MSDLITDAMVEAAAKAFANHEYCVNRPEKVPYCTCGWTATERYGVAEYDQHVARLTLEAAAPLIAAKALRDEAETYTTAIPDILGYKVQAVFTEDLLGRADRIERGES